MALFSIDPEWAALNQGGQSLDFRSNIATPTQDMATANSPGFGAAPVSQPQGMGFMDWIGKIGDLMQSTGAGLQGRPDPVMARKNLESEMAQRKQAMDLQRQDLEMRRQQQEMAKAKMLTDKLEKVLDIVQKSNIDEKAGTAILESYIQSDPDMAKVFAPHIGKFTLSPQAKVIKRQDYEAKAGEFSDPVSGNPLPAGRYDLEGTPKGGKFVITEIGPSKAHQAELKEVQTEQRFQLREEAIEERAQRREALQEKNMARLAAQNAATLAQGQQRIAQSDERLRIQEEQNKRLSPSQQKILTGNKNALGMIDAYEKAYDNLVKETGGATSAVMKGVLAKNQTAQTLADIAQLSGVTDAERKFAAEYNSMVGGLKYLTEEVGVLTDTDAVRILKSFNPAVTPAQMKANLASRKKTHERAFKNALEDYEAMGKDVTGFKNRPTGSQQASQGSAPSSSAPAVGTVQKGYRFKGGDPSKQENWEKVR